MNHRKSLESSLARAISRRSFLASSAALLALPRITTAAVRQPARFDTFPFTLGVASGDPAPDGVVLWTRLAPDPLNGGGMTPRPVQVGWEIATDDRMKNIVKRGIEVATPDLAHSVHAEVSGLRPDRWYWYRFHIGDATTEIARTRTLPAAGAAASRLRFSFMSCQHYETGLYTAYQHMATEDLDLAFHLGDYIYEGAAREGLVRQHHGVKLLTLDHYRDRYAQYKMDPHLQAAHAAFPWIVTPDDHEVQNNYANAVSERNDPIEEFLRQRAGAYKAYYEHMPLRRSSLPHGPDAQLYRRFSAGSLASFFVLDTRQFRTDQPCGDGTKPLCDAVFDPNATLMGFEQERWLLDGLKGSRSKWNVIPQQVMMAPADRAVGPERTVAMDQWGGYDVARTRLMKFFELERGKNPIVLSGDIHSNWVNDLRVDFLRPEQPTVATEFVGTSITSGGDGADMPETMPAVLAENPFVKFYNNQRGYVVVDVTADTVQADYRVVEYVTREGAPIKTRASFVVENGKPGAERAAGS